jgi:hypothetical protein
VVEEAVVFGWLREGQKARPGMRFRYAAAAVGGQPGSQVWEVEEVVVTRDGIEHARLRNSKDHTSNRLVAVSALLNPEQFLPEAETVD